MSRLLVFLLCGLSLWGPSRVFASCEANLRADSQLEEAAADFFQENKVVFIVNPVSSANQLAKVWEEEGYHAFFIWTDQCSDRHRQSFHPEDFHNPILKSFSLAKEAAAFASKEPIFEVSLKALQKIRALVFKKMPAPNPDAPLTELPRMLVVSGAESGIKWAQRFSAALGLPMSVDPSNIKSLRQKHPMHRNFERSEIPIIPQIYINSAKSGADWIAANHRKFSRFGPHWRGQYLLKPNDGASSNQLSVIHHPSELEPALDKLKNTRGIYGQKNTGGVLMPLLTEFREFAVNGAVVRSGERLHTRFTGVWEYLGRDLGAYGYEVLLPWYQVRPEIFDLVKKGLQASRYKRSAFHWEVMYLKHINQFFIVEGAGRLYGAGNTKIEGHCTGYSQIQAMIDSYIRPDKFIEEADRPYMLSHMGLVLNISGPENPEKKAYANDQAWNELKQLYQDHIFDLIPFMPHGQLLTETHNLSDTLAQIELVAPVAPYSHEEALLRILQIKDEIFHRRRNNWLWTLAQ